MNENEIISSGDREGAFSLIDWSLALLRLLVAAAMGIWVFTRMFGPAVSPGHLRILMTSYLGYGALLYAVIVLRPGVRWIMYGISAVLDIVFITVAVQLTGGLESPLVSLYFVLAVMIALYGGFLKGMIAALVLVVVHLAVNQDTTLFLVTGKTFSADADFTGLTIQWADLLLRIFLVFILAMTTGLFSVKFSRDFARLRESSRKQESLNQITEAIRSSMKIDPILDLILEKVSMSLGYERVILYLQEQEGLRKMLRYKKGIGVPKGLLDEKIYSVSTGSSEAAKVGATGIISRVVEQNKSYNIVNARTNYLCDQDLVEKLDLQAFAAVPLKVGDYVFGVIIVDHDGKTHSIPDEDVYSLSVFANQAGVAIENAKLHEETEKLAILDGLTNLHNHRFFQEFINDEINRTRRYGGSVSLIISDIDFFKHYNDTWGHPKGDDVLRDIAQIFRDSVRDVDLAARYGGEEFVVVLPHTDKEGAKMIADRICSSVAETPFPNQEQQPNGNVTVSVGVATFPEDAETKAELIQKADEQVYRAKEEGKNRVCVCGME